MVRLTLGWLVILPERAKCMCSMNTNLNLNLGNCKKSGNVEFPNFD